MMMKESPEYLADLFLVLLFVVVVQRTQKLFIKIDRLYSYNTWYTCFIMFEFLIRDLVTKKNRKTVCLLVILGHYTNLLSKVSIFSCTIFIFCPMLFSKLSMDSSNLDIHIFTSPTVDSRESNPLSNSILFE